MPRSASCARCALRRCRPPCYPETSYRGAAPRGDPRRPSARRAGRSRLRRVGPGSDDCERVVTDGHKLRVWQAEHAWPLTTNSPRSCAGACTPCWPKSRPGGRRTLVPLRRSGRPSRHRPVHSDLPTRLTPSHQGCLGRLSVPRATATRTVCRQVVRAGGTSRLLSQTTLPRPRARMQQTPQALRPSGHHRHGCRHSGRRSASSSVSTWW